MPQAQFRPAFDPAGIFIVAKPMKVSGKALAARTVFDNDSVDPRVLMRLFNSRHLVFESEFGGGLHRAPAPGPAMARDAERIARHREARRGDAPPAEPRPAAVAPPPPPAPKPKPLEQLLALIPKKKPDEAPKPAAIAPLDDRLLDVLQRMRAPLSAEDLQLRLRGGDPEFEPEHMAEAITLALERLRRKGLAMKKSVNDEGTRVAVWKAAPVIPADWRELSWPKLLSLASNFSLVRVANKAEAEAAIEAEMMRRAQQSA